jgi:hypothetical protein
VHLESPRRTPTSQVSVLHAENGRAWFAPSAVKDRASDDWCIMATGIAKSDMVFRDRTWPDGRTERWFSGGQTRVGAFTLQARGTLVPAMPQRWLNDLKDLEIMGIATAWRSSWCHIWFSAREPGGPWRIFHTSQLGSGSWRTPAPVVSPTLDTDREHVLLPAVLDIEGMWRMWYVGRDGRTRRIHSATSPDGITWTKHGVAVDVGAPGDCDYFGTDCPSVVSVDGALLMLYGAGSSRSIAAAMSGDGQKWTKLGPILHRATCVGMTSEYAFYPAIAEEDGVGRVVFAGEDSDHQWRLMATRPFQLSGLLQRRSPIRTPHDVTMRWWQHRVNLGQSHLAVTDDAFGAAPAYRSEDGSVTQVRPSSSAVLKIASDGGQCYAIKVGRSMQDIYAEYEAMISLDRWYNVVPAALQFTEDSRPYLVTPWLGRSLVSSARAEPAEFLRFLTDFLADLNRSFGQAMMIDDAFEADWPPQNLHLLRRWLNEAVRLLGYMAATDSRSAPDPKISELCACALVSLRQAPRWISPSPADHHLHNLLVHRDRYALIDLEFSGLIDVDYSVAKIVASVLKHTSAVSDAAAARPLSACTTLGWWQCYLTSDKVRWARVIAFVLAKMIFRLRSSGRGVLPAVSILAEMMKTAWAEI